MDEATRKLKHKLQRKIRNLKFRGKLTTAEAKHQRQLIREYVLLDQLEYHLSELHNLAVGRRMVNTRNTRRPRQSSTATTASSSSNATSAGLLSPPPALSLLSTPTRTPSSIRPPPPLLAPFTPLKLPTVAPVLTKKHTMAHYQEMTAMEIGHLLANERVEEALIKEVRGLMRKKQQAEKLEDSKVTQLENLLNPEEEVNPLELAGDGWSFDANQHGKMTPQQFGALVRLFTSGYGDNPPNSPLVQNLGLEAYSQTVGVPTYKQLVEKSLLQDAKGKEARVQLGKRQATEFVKDQMTTDPTYDSQPRKVLRVDSLDIPEVPGRFAEAVTSSTDFLDAFFRH